MNTKRILLPVVWFLLSTFNPQPLTFAQGLLTPPGVPAPTMKTLEQVEARIPIDAARTPGDATNVYRITAPGSYYLTQNISTASGKNGILIDAIHVIVDLNGFTINGGGPDSLSGIQVGTGHHNITVRNGNITGWGSSGIAAADSANCLFEKIEAIANIGDGFRLGHNTTVRSCKVRDNIGHGMSFDGDATITECTSENSTLSGFLLRSGVVSKSVATSNGVHGFESRAAAFSDCLAGNNGGAGFQDAGNKARPARAKRTKPTREGPGRDGGKGVIQAGSYSACVANGNTGWGFQINAGPMTVNACTSDSNSGGGIQAGGGSNITECTVTNNNGEGIEFGNGTTVAGCTASFNGLAGIYAVAGYSRLVANTCDGNGWGLYASGSRTRIEGNNLTGNGTGMEIISSDNLIIRNSASDNFTNYVIAADNKVGPIVSAPNSLAINGSTGGAGAGSTDPWANISY